MIKYCHSVVYPCDRPYDAGFPYGGVDGSYLVVKTGVSQWWDNVCRAAGTAAAPHTPKHSGLTAQVS